MSRACSVSAGRVYGKARVCRLWTVARSTRYARQAAVERPVQARRRGRKPVLSDEALVANIREVLSEAEALGIRGATQVRFQGKGSGPSCRICRL